MQACGGFTGVGVCVPLSSCPKFNYTKYQTLTKICHFEKVSPPSLIYTGYGTVSTEGNSLSLKDISMQEGEVAYGLENAHQYMHTTHRVLTQWVHNW